MVKIGGVVQDVEVGWSLEDPGPLDECGHFDHLGDLLIYGEDHVDAAVALVAEMLRLREASLCPVVCCGMPYLLLLKGYSKFQGKKPEYYPLAHLN